MKLLQMFRELQRLFQVWGVGPDGWMLILHYANRLQGYDVHYGRQKHFHVLFPRQSVPWRLRRYTPDEVIVPPEASQYFRSYRQFMRRTGYDFHLFVTTDKFFKEFRKTHSTIFLLGKLPMHVATVIGFLHYNDRYFRKHWKKLSPEILRRRFAYYFLLRDEAKRRKDIKVARMTQELLDRYYPAEDKGDSAVSKDKIHANGLRGKGVFGKKVRGTVCLVLRPDRPPHIPARAILVCPFTGPKLLPYLKRVAGVVTDEGGALSHAAVYCREAKLPCIVGTHFATKVFKNGDRVEVDAAKGIVRKV